MIVTGKQNISDEMLLNDWFLLTWSAKWLFKDEVLNAKLKPKEAKEQNDLRIIKSIWIVTGKQEPIIN